MGPGTRDFVWVSETRAPYSYFGRKIITISINRTSQISGHLFPLMTRLVMGRASEWFALKFGTIINFLSSTNINMKQSLMGQLNLLLLSFIFMINL